VSPWVVEVLLYVFVFISIPMNGPSVYNTNGVTVKFSSAPWLFWVCVCVCVCVHKCVYACVCMLVCVCVHMCACVWKVTFYNFESQFLSSFADHILLLLGCSLISQ
jgi:hypothetical protein